MKNASVKFIAVLFVSLSLMPHAFSDPVCDTKDKKETINPDFHELLLDIASKYKSYGKVDDMAKWAPWLCTAPMPPKARLSSSGDFKTHGRKLYFLFASNRNEYVSKATPTVGQTIVKESWIKENVRSQDVLNDVSNSSVNPPKLSHQSDLFIMTKLATHKPNTDNGWVYGTVTADGKTVTSAGRVESCMKCHLQAKNDRLFGLKDDTKESNEKSSTKN